MLNLAANFETLALSFGSSGEVILYRFPRVSIVDLQIKYFSGWIGGSMCVLACVPSTHLNIFAYFASKLI